MSKNKKKTNCRVKIDNEKQSLKIFTDKQTHQEIIRFLLKKDCFVKDHRNLTNHFLELDYRGISELQETGFRELSISPQIPSELTADLITEKIVQENELQKHLEEKNYDLDLRIWEKEADGTKIYFCDVDGEVYSCRDSDGLISFLRGETLIESNKPLTSFSINPLTVFGAFDVVSDALSSDKSLVRYNFRENRRKKQFHPLIENSHHLRIVIDGADDTANAMNNTGLPQQTVALIQGLVIFPLFLKGVHLGYEGLGEEAKETYDEYNATHIKRAEIETKLEQFKRNLCEKCKIDFDQIKDDAPNKFLKKVAAALHQIDSEIVKNEIIDLAANYQKEMEADLGAPEIKDVLAAHCGWLAMTAMMTSVAFYEAQAVFNIFGGIDKITTGSNGTEGTLFSTIGNSFGFAGQSLMAIYAFHKMIDERKEWKEAEAELEKFRDAKDVSDLARQITDELLVAKRDNHRLQTFGNAALSAGQAMMAVGGPIGIGLNPLLFTGLGLTLGGVAVNSISELKYQSSYQIDEDIDDLERSIITRSPDLRGDDFQNISVALARNAKERILELEILGNLRAPEFVLYQKFSEQNKDDVGIIDKTIGVLGGNRISKWLNKPPSTSISFIKDNPLITPHNGNPNDLDVFGVKEEDLKNALARYKELSSTGTSHLDAIKTIQAEFIVAKSQETKARPAKTTKELCRSIIEKDGAAGSYLTKKLMRAAANGDLVYNGNLEEGVLEIRKNGKKIVTAKLDLDKFNENEIENFLSQKRKQKGLFGGKKKSPLEKSHENEIYVVKSDHLRPFAEIAKVSVAATDFLDGTKPNRKVEHKPVDNSSTNAHQVASKNSLTRSKTDKRIYPKAKESQTINHHQHQSSLESQSQYFEKSLLTEFGSLASEEVASNKAERGRQITKQNKVIDKVLSKSREFILKSQTKNSKTNETIFVWADPDYTDLETAEGKARQVIYVCNDITGKIDVLYGQKANALVIERPTEEKNGLITKVKNNNVEHHGQTNNSIFQSFQSLNKTPNPSPSKTTAVDSKKSEIKSSRFS